MLPCSQEYSEFSFGAALLGRRGYVQEEREALFSQYGTVLKDWRVVMQVASVPERNEVAGGPPDFSGISLSTGDRSIARPGLERMAVEFLRSLEYFGVAEGPKWPSISVIPLGIYRRVPQGRK
jgi:hypothetical protein